MQNAKCKNAKCKMQNAKCKMQNAKFRMENGKRKMENEKWRMEMGHPPVLLALRDSDNITFSLTWPAAMQLYRKDRKCQHK